MPFPPSEYLSYLSYVAPPLVGAFIGYVTNRIAIRMLFRPLKPWHLFGCRIPMTPGVIPSQRHRLADNMGEVVGEQLLTSEEIGAALQSAKFQQHLLNVIAERVGAILHRDLPTLPEMIPDKFAIYREFGIRALKQHLRGNINKFIQSPAFSQEIDIAITKRLTALMECRIDEVVNGRGREALYRFIAEATRKLMASETMAGWLMGFIRQQAHEALWRQKSISQLLPASLIVFLQDSISSHTPTLLKKVAKILKEPEVRDSIVKGVCGGIDNFIQSLGPMAPMAQNFLLMTMVEQKIREYLDEKEEDIVNWLSSEDLQEKVSAILAERFATFIDQPLIELISAGSPDTVNDFCGHLSQQLLHILRGQRLQQAFIRLIRDNVENHLEDGDKTIGMALTELLGEDGTASLESWIHRESLGFLRSAETVRTIGSMADRLVDGILTHRVGKLANILSEDVRREIYVSIQKITATMLAQEVPGLVASLDIRAIVAAKLNSLDLLRLERLLLSIMEEQFKYINLFGALLGFLIGCLNLLFFRLS
ncbi:MAG: DUF445 family protein [Desulfopila sp.]